MSLALANRIDLLRDRAQMLSRARAFFAMRGVLEVDVPLLTRYPSVDAHIDLVEANCAGKKAYLHTSPEYGMKRLLAEGVGDCYQLSHVFRAGEVGERHNPEFTMAEWYRQGYTFEEMMAETAEFVQVFLEVSNVEYLKYEALFEKCGAQDKDLYFATQIEPHLGKEKLTFVTDFPPEEAALAEVEGGRALRFELFYRGVELANGYRELREVGELARRFEVANHKRAALGKCSYVPDPLFLEAHTQGFPPCCGVAVGFDRLMMLRHRVGHVREVIAFDWEVA